MESSSFYERTESPKIRHPKSPKSALSRTSAQFSYQKDIKIRTAQLRQALHKADDEAALIFRSLPTIVDSGSHANKNNKLVAVEADDFVSNMSSTLNRWRRTSTMAAETFAELLAETSKSKETAVDTEAAINQADEEIQNLWLATTRIQAEIDYVEDLLARESAPLKTTEYTRLVGRSPSASVNLSSSGSNMNSNPNTSSMYSYATRSLPNNGLGQHPSNSNYIR